MVATTQPRKGRFIAMGKVNCCSECSGYFEHRVGSHSDDWGGDSDLPCYCNKDECHDPKCKCHTKLNTKEDK